MEPKSLTTNHIIVLAVLTVLSFWFIAAVVFRKYADGGKELCRIGKYIDTHITDINVGIGVVLAMTCAVLKTLDIEFVDTEVATWIALALAFFSYRDIAGKLLTSTQKRFKPVQFHCPEPDTSDDTTS